MEKDNKRRAGGPLVAIIPAGSQPQRPSELTRSPNEGDESLSRAQPREWTPEMHGESGFERKKGHRPVAESYGLNLNTTRLLGVPP
jgi:hypothetical protein